jgi:hypothetical protein
MLMTTDNTLRIAELFGAVLTGRPMAGRVTQAVDQALASGRTLTLDFAGVKAVSPSFADELFGKLSLRDPDGKIDLVNLSAHLQSVARMAQRQRQIGETL